ncbi:hypothetical protein [Sorangium sp. So ce887]|uniref:hypothetical protein n=1 Tax=Sorangium sp. So ce887 TaxID=3133324 RepID=UPI003F62A751
MATELDKLIVTEKGQQDALAKDISKGLAAQAGLAQVQAVLADLTALQRRRESLVEGAEARLAAANASAGEVTAGLVAVDAMFTNLPGTLKLTDLDALVAADLPAPPDATKKTYAAYVAARATADADAATATTAVALARDGEAQARVSIDRAEATLQAAVDVAATAAAAAKSALADALRAKSAGDFAGAYWFEQRAKALAAVVSDAATSKAVTDAEAALRTAFDGAADATDLRIKAETALGQKQADRSKAGDQLGSAAGQVLKQLSNAVAKAKAGP